VSDDADKKKVIGDLLKRAVSMGTEAYLSAEEKVSKTLSAVQIPKDFLKESLENFFESYKLQIQSEVSLKPVRESQTKETLNVMEKKVIQTARAPKAIGPYSQAIDCGSMVFCSGQIPLDPVRMEFAASDIKGQTEQVLKNLTAVLEEAGLSLADVVKTTVFVKDLGQFPLMNEVYESHFSKVTKNFPARSTVEVAALPKGALVEIEAIALRK
jgi:2-iminobutanoate/2-iminopropanoate deaminase